MNDCRFQLKSLKGKKRFSEVFSKGKRFSSPKLLLTIEMKDPLQSGESNVIEFAVIVGKRTSKSAVIRNRIKRLLRESIRFHFPIVFGDLETLPFQSVLLNWRQAPKHQKLIGLAEVSNELLLALSKVRRHLKV